MTYQLGHVLQLLPGSVQHLSSSFRFPQNMPNATYFPSIDVETRTAVDTATAAFHLNRKPQTLRVWATYESGPIRPIRVYGRLAWPVAEIRRILGCAPASNDKEFKFSA